jgi:hypothetical protein
MRLPMMGAAEGNGELVADLATERASLKKAARLR